MSAAFVRKEGRKGASQSGRNGGSADLFIFPLNRNKNEADGDGDGDPAALPIILQFINVAFARRKGEKRREKIIEQ